MAIDHMACAGNRRSSAQTGSAAGDGPVCAGKLLAGGEAETGSGFADRQAAGQHRFRDPDAVLPDPIAWRLPGLAVELLPQGFASHPEESGKLLD